MRHGLFVEPQAKVVVTLRRDDITGVPTPVAIRDRP
jgi:hypothetical protein